MLVFASLLLAVPQSSRSDELAELVRMLQARQRATVPSFIAYRVRQRIRGSDAESVPLESGWWAVGDGRFAYGIALAGDGSSYWGAWNGAELVEVFGRNQTVFPVNGEGPPELDSDLGRAVIHRRSRPVSDVLKRAWLPMEFGVGMGPTPWCQQLAQSPRVELLEERLVLGRRCRGLLVDMVHSPSEKYLSPMRIYVDTSDTYLVLLAESLLLPEAMTDLGVSPADQERFRVPVGETDYVVFQRWQVMESARIGGVAWATRGVLSHPACPSLGTFLYQVDPAACRDGRPREELFHPRIRESPSEPR